MAVTTPLGLYPSAAPGCGAAAARCLGIGFGCVNAFPPPRYLLVGRATRVQTKSSALSSALLRVSMGLVLQGVVLTPLLRPLSATALERSLRGVAVLFQCLRHHHPRVVQRCSCPSGGTSRSLAAVLLIGPRVDEFWKLGCCISLGYCGCCSGTEVPYCYHCDAADRWVPWPLAGVDTACVSGPGLDSLSPILANAICSLARCILAAAIRDHVVTELACIVVGTSMCCPGARPAPASVLLQDAIADGLKSLRCRCLRCVLLRGIAFSLPGRAISVLVKSTPQNVPLGFLHVTAAVPPPSLVTSMFVCTTLGTGMTPIIISARIDGRRWV